MNLRHRDVTKNLFENMKSSSENASESLKKKEQNKAKKKNAQLKAKRAEEKKRTKIKRLQHEQVKDVSDLPEVGQTNDIPIYGHNEQEDQVNSQPNKRKTNL